MANDPAFVATRNRQDYFSKIIFDPTTQRADDVYRGPDSGHFG